MNLRYRHKKSRKIQNTIPGIRIPERQQRYPATAEKKCKGLKNQMEKLVGRNY